jgi:hypothetical protein
MTFRWRIRLPERGAKQVLPGAEDADGGGICDAVVVTRRRPRSWGDCGALVVMVPVAVG